MELEDLGKFEKTFYISNDTGYGIDNFRDWLKE
jgi:hypothetical protein